MSADLKFEWEEENNRYEAYQSVNVYWAEICQETTIRGNNVSYEKTNAFIVENKNCLVFRVYCNRKKTLEETVDFSPNEFSGEQKHKALKACLRNWLKAHAEVFLTASIEDEY